MRQTRMKLVAEPVQQTPEVEESCREFDEAVKRGEYDENGYTPAEAKAARKRGTYDGTGVMSKLRTGELYLCGWCGCLAEAAHACWDEKG